MNINNDDSDIEYIFTKEKCIPYIPNCLCTMGLFILFYRNQYYFRVNTKKFIIYWGLFIPAFYLSNFATNMITYTTKPILAKNFNWVNSA